MEKKFTLEERVQRARGLRSKGYTCSQSVLCVFADLLDTDERELFRISEGFGGGMGGLMLTCGAVSSMAIAAGLKNSTANLEKGDSKGATIRLVRKMAIEFEEKNGSLICRELQGIDTGTVLRDCPGCIEDAVRLIGRELFGLTDAN